MKLIKVAAAVLNQTPLAWDGNLANILDGDRRGPRRRRDASSACPSSASPATAARTRFMAGAAGHGVASCSRSSRRRRKGMVVSLGSAAVYHERRSSTPPCLVADGQILGFVAKQFLAGDGIHYEPRWFKPWPSGARARARLTTASAYPLGDLMFDVGGVRIGFEICEDAWVANRPGGELALRGVDIILNPERQPLRLRQVRRSASASCSRARARSASRYLYANLLGNEAGRAIYDGGALIASGGKLLASGPRFSLRRRQLTTAVVDIDATRMSQARTGSFRPDIDGRRERRASSAPFSYPPLPSRVGRRAHRARWETRRRTSRRKSSPAP